MMPGFGGILTPLTDTGPGQARLNELEWQFQSKTTAVGATDCTAWFIQERISTHKEMGSFSKSYLAVKSSSQYLCMHTQYSADHTHHAIFQTQEHHSDCLLIVKTEAK